MASVVAIGCRQSGRRRGRRSSYTNGQQNEEDSNPESDHLRRLDPASGKSSTTRKDNDDANNEDIVRSIESVERGWYVAEEAMLSSRVFEEKSQLNDWNTF